jgi:hypothetical protein
MDPVTSKKRPGGALESPFASIRKSPKPAAPAANPYQTQASVPQEPELTADELAKVRHHVHILSPKGEKLQFQN